MSGFIKVSEVVLRLASNAQNYAIEERIIAAHIIDEVKEVGEGKIKSVIVLQRDAVPVTQTIDEIYAMLKEAKAK